MTTRVRKIKNILFKTLICTGSAIAAAPLCFILYFIVQMGWKSINWNFFVEIPKPVGESGGGIANALVGSALLLLVACVMAVPIGISVGVYLSEFSNKGPAKWIRLSMEVLSGVPSIVIGILVYAWVVKPMGHFSALSGSIALAIMMLPIMVRTAEETLKLIPSTLKEAAFALGAPYSTTILKVVLPAGISGLVTGVLLAFARIVGETAPLLFTAFGNPYISTNLFKPVASLPLILFNYAISPYEDWHTLAWGASFLLVLFILLLNLTAKLVSLRWKVLR